MIDLEESEEMGTDWMTRDQHEWGVEGSGVQLSWEQVLPAPEDIPSQAQHGTQESSAAARP